MKERREREERGEGRREREEREGGERREGKRGEREGERGKEREGGDQMEFVFLLLEDR